MRLRALRYRLRPYDRVVERTAWVCCLVLPLALLHARALAEMLIGAIDVLFLVHAWSMRDTDWLTRPFTVAALGWWAWLVVCSAIGSGLELGLAAVRLPLLAVALGHWLLPDGKRQRWLWAVLAACLGWIAVECWQQYLTGHNLFGQARWGDGALTGPFNKPRAGPAFILLFFPVLAPAGMALLAGTRLWRRAAGLACLALGVLTMVLIGQRMPSLLMLLGLAVTALLLPRLRLAVLATALAGGLAVAALPVLSPAANGKLVGETIDQFRHFGESDYGLIIRRALQVVQRHPWVGRGFDGFRTDCARELSVPRVEGVLPPPEIRACNLHPHNYYLEAADNAGWLGLACFAAMVLAALMSLGRHLGRPPDRLRVGMLTGTLVALCPVATTSAFTSMPNGGWVFLVLGFGLALAWGARGGTSGAQPRFDAGRGTRRT